MAKYRKLPVVVEAVQWFKDGDSPKVIDHAGFPAVVTDHGEVAVSPGDWIITGVKGESYPCAPDVFDLTYEPIQEPKPMSLRFGPRIDHTVTADVPAPAPVPDTPAVKVPVEIEAFIGDATPLGDGTYRLDCGAKVPGYSADTSKVLRAVFAVAVPDGQPVPETEQAFLDSSYPKGGLDLAPPDGNPLEVTLPVSGVPAGKVVVQYILMDED